MNTGISKKEFGIYEEKPVMEYTLHNANGMKVSVINYGATITKIIVAGKENNYNNVIIGFDDLESYLKRSNQYIGCIVGRYCNRIAHGRFSLDGKEYKLAQNNNNNSLHGGYKGFDKAWWDIEKEEATNSLILTYLSKDGEENFPGNLNTTVIYTLTDDNELKIDYAAITDAPTPVNLTSHCYFNLSGQKDVSILDHELQISADHYTAVNAGLIPTGEIVAVQNTSLDFSPAKKIGKDIHAAGGFDHNFVLNKDENDFSLTPYHAAFLYDASSGRQMEVLTSEPAIQFYTAKSINEKTNNEDYTALCLEAQHYPNSPNEPSFPNTILRPGETYRQTTIYKFSVK